MSGTNSAAKLSPAAIYCLSEAINKLHEAARLADRDMASELIVIADKIEVVKREGAEE